MFVQCNLIFEENSDVHELVILDLHGGLKFAKEALLFQMCI